MTSIYTYWLRDGKVSITDDDGRVNRNPGAQSSWGSARHVWRIPVGTAELELVETGGRYSLSTIYISVGQGIAVHLSLFKGERSGPPLGV